MIKLSDIVNDILDSELNEKQKVILIKRYGLGGDFLTLQEIGDDFGITRERVRQIINHSVGKLRPAIASELEPVVISAEDFLKLVGGVRRDDYFVVDLKHINEIEEEENWSNYLRFILLVTEKPQYFKSTDDLFDFWYLDEQMKRFVLKHIDQFIAFLRKQKPEKIINDHFHFAKYPNLADYHYLSISKVVGCNHFGDFGLKTWPEIEPKVVRDKAYLIVKKHRRPMHFREIADLINQYYGDYKRAHPQTVHNELIKDDRFVLVGRGIYALKEHGFEKGTVKDIIRKAIEENGPLTVDEVVDIVSSKKLVKRNTIIINLQNRKQFKRLPDGRYTLI